MKEREQEISNYIALFSTFPLIIFWVYCSCFQMEQREQDAEEDEVDDDESESEEVLWLL